MFEQTFVDDPGRASRPAAIAASLLLQCVAVAASILLPLIHTYELPVEAWLSTALVFAPPRPPRPPAPKAPEPVAQPRPPARFEQTLVAPQLIPESVAIYAEPTAAIAGSPAPDIGVYGGAAGGVRDGVLGVAAAASLVAPAMPLAVGGRVQAAKMIHRVDPVYPAEAREQGISGVVKLEAIVNVAGAIRDVKVLEGDPVLAASAVEAVRQWRYRPTLLNGVPVEVITQFQVSFRLAEPLAVDDEEEPRKGRRRR